MSVEVTRETTTKMVEVTTEVRKYNVSMTEGEARVVRALLGRLAGLPTKNVDLHTSRLFRELNDVLVKEGAVQRFGQDIELVDLEGDRIDTIHLKEYK